jgi:hypothetical protein
MRVAVAAAGLAICLAGAARGEDACSYHPSPHYPAGVAHQLSAKGVPYRLVDGGICVTEGRGAELEAAQRRMFEHFGEVAYHLRDACEERAYVEWAEREKLRFEVSEVVDLGGKPAGRMFHLRSFTAEEAAEHRRKLQDAPRGASCEGGTATG